MTAVHTYRLGYLPDLLRWSAFAGRVQYLPRNRLKRPGARVGALVERRRFLPPNHRYLDFVSVKCGCRVGNVSRSLRKAWSTAVSGWAVPTTGAVAVAGWRRCFESKAHIRPW